MFGITIIKTKDYYSLIDNFEKAKSEITFLKEEFNKQIDINEQCKNTVQKLTEEINQQTSNCKVGPWCEDCNHKKKATIGLGWNRIISNKLNATVEYHEGDYIIYCGKHLHELCPEWEHIKIIK